MAAGEEIHRLSRRHRNVARTQYGIQGWKKAKIYPDFIFAVHHEGKAKCISVLETKGDQLDNLDTAYKREILSFLSNHFVRLCCNFGQRRPRMRRISQRLAEQVFGRSGIAQAREHEVDRSASGINGSVEPGRGVSFQVRRSAGFPEGRPSDPPPLSRSG